MRKTAVVLGLLLAFSVHAQSAPELVRDFRKTFDFSDWSEPAMFFSNGERAFFFADDGQGRELWTSDGTASGTRLLAELTPGEGPEYLDAAGFFASGDLVYFWHRDEFTDHRELWRTDGTPAGTFSVLNAEWWDIQAVAFGERGAIVVTNELHVTDGESSYTIEFPFSSGPMVNVNGVVYGVSNGQLWRTDGTVAGTREVFDFDTYVDGYGLVVHDGAIYLLSLSDGDSHVWRSDGTTAGTIRVASFENVTGDPRLLAIEAGVYALVNRGATTDAMRVSAAGASLAFVIPGEFLNYYFAAASRDFFAYETSAPRRLWRSDGTPHGTRAIAEEFYDAVLTGTQVIFDSQSGVWEHDGTSAQLLTPRRPPNDLEIAQVGERFLLTLQDDEHGGELWISDGSASGTALLKNIRPDGHSEGSLARRIGSSIFFRARSDEHGLEPWVIDEGGLRVIDVDFGPDSSNPRMFTEVNGRLMFLSDPEWEHPHQIRVTDGNGLHTIMFYDFQANWPNESASFPVAGDRAFLFGYGEGYEVWTTGGTIESTQRGTALPWVDDDFDPVAANGVAFFVSGSDSLWRTDGTLAGTYALASNVQQVHVTPSKLFFIAHGTAHGTELWVSDGTLAGTHVVKDIHPGTEDAFLYSYDYEAVFQTLGDAIVFAANDGVHGLEPWISDGTEAGTFLLRDVAPGAASSMLPRFDREVTASASGFAYFVADDGAHGRELWRTDGTASGTQLVRDIARGRASSTPMRMRAIGDRVYFSADDGVHGRELWWSSLAGAGLAADVAPGSDSSLPHDMTELDGWIYFFAQTEATGDELWRVAAPRVRRRAAR